MVVQRLELEQETEKGVLVLTEELTSLVVAKILKLAIAASQRKNSSPGATKRQLSVSGFDFFAVSKRSRFLNAFITKLNSATTRMSPSSNLPRRRWVWFLNSSPLIQSGCGIADTRFLKYFRAALQRKLFSKYFQTKYKVGPIDRKT